MPAPLDAPWDFRLVRGEDGGLAVHVVFYNKKGFVSRIADEPATFEVEREDDRRQIIDELQQALYGARDKPIIDFDAPARGDVR